MVVSESIEVCNGLNLHLTFRFVFFSNERKCFHSSSLCQAHENGGSFQTCSRARAVPEHGAAPLVGLDLPAGAVRLRVPRACFRELLRPSV